MLEFWRNGYYGRKYGYTWGFNLVPYFLVVEWNTAAGFVAGSMSVLVLMGLVVQILLGRIAAAPEAAPQAFSDSCPVAVYKLWHSAAVSPPMALFLCWFLILFFFWLRASKVLVNSYFLIAIFFRLLVYNKKV